MLKVSEEAKKDKDEMMSKLFKAQRLTEDMQYGAMQSGNKEMEIDLKQVSLLISESLYSFQRYDGHIAKDNIEFKAVEVEEVENNNESYHVQL